MAKARRQKLKVFRTPIGFHDAYVAAPSRKAALQAWGAGTDLFSAGIAEEVKDHGGGAAVEALAKRGEVVRVKRTGGDVVPLQAKGKKQKEGGPRTRSGATKQSKRAPKPKPRPSRAALDKAEQALARLEAKQAAEEAELDKEEVRLANRRRALERKHREAMERAEARRDEAERAYRKAMKEWAK